MRRTVLVMCACLMAGVAGAHAGHNEFGVFDPPHGGAFAKMADFYAEIYLEGGKLFFCLEWPSGEPADNEYIPEHVELRVTPKHGKTIILTRESAGDDGCVSWTFTTTAKRVKVVINATIDEKPAKTTVTWEAGR